MTWYLPTISKLHTILHPLAHCVSHLVMFVSWGRCWAPKHRLLQGRWKWLDQLTPFDTQLFSLMGLGQNECSECRPNFTYFDFWWLGWNGKEGDIYSTIVLQKTDGIHGPRSRKRLTSQQGYWAFAVHGALKMVHLREKMSWVQCLDWSDESTWMSKWFPKMSKSSLGFVSGNYYNICFGHNGKSTVGEYLIHFPTIIGAKSWLVLLLGRQPS